MELGISGEFLGLQELKKVFEEVKRCQDSGEIGACKCKWGALLNAELGGINLLVAYHRYYEGESFEKIFNGKIENKFKRDLVSNTVEFHVEPFWAITESTGWVDKFRIFFPSSKEPNLEFFKNKISPDDSLIVDVKTVSCLTRSWYADKYINFIQFQKLVTLSKQKENIDYTLCKLLEVMFYSSCYDICVPENVFEEFLQNRLFKQISPKVGNKPEINEIISANLDAVKGLIQSLRQKMTNKLVFDVSDVMVWRRYGFHLNSLADIRSDEIVKRFQEVMISSRQMPGHHVEIGYHSRENSLKALVIVLSHILCDMDGQKEDLVLILSREDYVDLTSKDLFIQIAEQFEAKVLSKIDRAIDLKDMVGGHAIIINKNCLQIERNKNSNSFETDDSNSNDILRIQEQFTFYMPLNLGVRIQMVGYNAVSPYRKILYEV